MAEDNAASHAHTPLLSITAEDPASADAQVLIDALSDTLAGITGDSGRSGFDPADVRDPRSLFVVARAQDGTPVGCGAYRPLEAGIAELKRMYARPDTRGVGDAVLDVLETSAAAAGYEALWLETRRVNLRAVRFYVRRGYREIPNFGRYADLPEAICLARALAPLAP